MRRSAKPHKPSTGLMNNSVKTKIVTERQWDDGVGMWSEQK